MHVHEYISYTEQKLERLSKAILIGKNAKNINGKLVTFLLSNGILRIRNMILKLKDKTILIFFLVAKKVIKVESDFTKKDKINGKAQV